MSFKTGLMLTLIVLGATSVSRAALAEVVVVVAAKNPLTSLTKSQVVDVFLGKTTRFPDGSPAVPVDLQEGSPTRDEFYAVLAGLSAAQLKAYWAKIIFTGRGQPPRTAAGPAEIRKLLVADPHVIAYVDRSVVDDSMKILGRP
jgi:ABC-type phosphate transport system substrate-binding protein